jgi:hypothetical protein
LRLDETVSKLLVAQQLDSGVDAADRIALLAAVRRWMAKDPVECLNFLHNHAAGGLIPRDEVMRALLRLASGDTNSLIRAARALSDKRLADAVFARTTRSATARAPDAGIEAFLAMPKYLQERMEGEICKTISTRFGVQGVQTLLDRHSFSLMGALEAFESLARTDPDGAFRMFNAYQHQLTARNYGVSSDAKHSIDADAQILGRIVSSSSDSGVSLTWLSGMAKSEFIDGLLRDAIADQITRAPSRVDELSKQAGSDAVASTAIGAAAQLLVNSQPATARQLIEKISSSRHRADLYSLSAHWLWDNEGGASRALQFVATIPNAVDRARTVDRSKKEWLRQDAQQTIEFAAAQVSDPVFAHFLRTSVAERLNPQDPAVSTKQLGFLASLSSEGKHALRNSVAPTLPEPKRALLLGIMK